MTKRLDAAAAQDLIERALESIGGEVAVAKAKPVIEAALEVARQSSRAAGVRSLSLSGISVHSGDEVVLQVANSAPAQPIDAKKKRIPIAYGGTGYVCFLVSKGPPPQYVCFNL